ncbi:hypothetical protein A3715_11315 [Oleiphilus sp. HI0009]|nr:hypothetical protein A3715_11315 [Oleiphilus sp. HI0009]
MKVKRVNVFLTEENLQFLEVVGGTHAVDIDLNLSSALNLCLQFSQLTSGKGVSLFAEELLFCCDVMNGGAQLTEFKEPDTVSIKSSIDSMYFNIISAIANDYDGLLNKWGINDKDGFLKRIQGMENQLNDLWTLGLSTRHFWSRIDLKHYRSVENMGDYKSWADQWINEAFRKTEFRGDA